MVLPQLRKYSKLCAAINFHCHGSAVVLPADDLADYTLKNRIIHSTKLPKDDIAENSNDNCLNFSPYYYYLL